MLHLGLSVVPIQTLPICIKACSDLIKEVAGGKISSEIKDVYPEKIDKWEVEISYKNVDRLIGNEIEREIIKEILIDLDIEI